MSNLRVCIAEDNLFVREGLRRIIEAQPDLEVVAAASTLPELLEAVQHYSPDVVLTDIRMPPGHADEGIQAAAILRESHPHLGVLVLSQYDEPRYAVRLLARGSDGRGFLLKDRVDDAAELMRALRRVAMGGSVVDPKVVEKLVSANRQRDSLLDPLSDRERQVLAMMAEGLNNEAIASALHISLGSLEKHINSVFSKLGLAEEREVNRRVRAVLLYLADRR